MDADFELNFLIVKVRHFFKEINKPGKIRSVVKTKEINFKTAIF